MIWETRTGRRDDGDAGRRDDGDAGRRDDGDAGRRDDDDAGRRDDDDAGRRDDDDDAGRRSTRGRLSASVARTWRGRRPGALPRGAEPAGMGYFARCRCIAALRERLTRPWRSISVTTTMTSSPTETTSSTEGTW